GFYYNTFVLSVIRENMLHKIKHRQLKHVNLTKRELEILQLICEQFTTSEIAEKLFISPRTVDGHRNNLLEKTGAKNTAGLVVFALENKVVEVDKSWF
ncbi:MAG: LuxR C-terminal-related transcriptional regulator, partial [Bacteroidota bacterium]